jgi:hypothetical protein
MAIVGGFYPQIVSNIAALRLLTPASTGFIAQTAGYTTSNDGGQNVFAGAVGAPAGTYVDNGGSIIVPTGGNGSAAWLQVALELNVKQFGAVADAAYNTGGGDLNVSANGTTTITLISQNNGFIATGMSIALVNWHSGGGTNVPLNTTITGIGPGNSITVSNPVATAPNLWLSAWYPGNSTNITGTDNTTAFQNAINAAMQSNWPEVYVPSGAYKITNTLHMGYGEAFHEVSLVGANRFPLDFTQAGAKIFSTINNAPAIVFQGVRMCGLRNISLFGPMYNFAQNAQGNSGARSDDEFDWMDPNFNASGSTPGGLQNNTPLVGVAIDPYSGGPPSAPYPNITFPAWVLAIAPTITTYNNPLFSSSVTMESVRIAGFVMGYGAGLNANSQGDFAKFNDCIIDVGSIGIGIYQQNSRLVELRNCQMRTLCYALDNTNYGQFHGLWQLNAISTSFQSCQRWFSLQMGQAGPCSFRSCYCEDVTLLGYVSGALGFNSGITFEDCKFNLNPTGGLIPPYLLTTVFATIPFRFKNCAIGDVPRMTTIVQCNNGAPMLEIDNCNFYTMANQISAAFNATTSGTTAIGSRVLNFSGGVPSNVVTGMRVIDATAANSASIPANTTVVSYTATTVTISANVVSPGVGSGDTITFSAPWVQQAMNYTGGLLAGAPRFNANDPTFGLPVDQTRWYGRTNAPAISGNDPSYTVITQQLSDEIIFDTWTMVQSGKWFRDTLGKTWTVQVPREATISVSNDMSVGPTWSGDYMSFTLKSSTYGSALGNAKVAPGWLLYHINSGIIFLVIAVGAADGSGNFPITTQQQNGLYLVGGIYSSNTINATTLGGGSFVVINTNQWLPGNQVYYGTFSTGSMTVSNVTWSPTGDATTLSDYFLGASFYTNGIFFWPPIQQPDTTYSPWPFITGPIEVTSVTNGGATGSIVLSGLPGASGRFPIWPFPIK